MSNILCSGCKRRPMIIVKEAGKYICPECGLQKDIHPAPKPKQFVKKVKK